MKNIIKFADKVTINGELIFDITDGKRVLRVILPNVSKFIHTIDESMENYWAESRLKGLLLEIIIK